MATDFVINDKKLKQLAKNFGITENSCKGLFKIYEDSVSNTIRTQYLAHIIRSIELSMREMTSNKLFTITCAPLSMPKNFRKAQCRYYPNRCFIIYFNENLPEPDRRNAIAHELGHLFWVEFANKYSSRKQYGSGHKMEPLASLFGIFAIAAKNNFYQNDAPKHRKRITLQGWNGLVNDFIQLKNSP